MTRYARVRRTILTSRVTLTGDAAEWARDAEETARGLDPPGRTGAALHAAAMPARDPADGADLARRAADELAWSHPIEAGRVRVSVGRRLAAIP